MRVRTICGGSAWSKTFIADQAVLIKETDINYLSANLLEYRYIVLLVNGQKIWGYVGTPNLIDALYEHLNRWLFSLDSYTSYDVEYNIQKLKDKQNEN